MNCKKCQALLSVYIDKELSEEENTQVEKHVKLCSVCRERLHYLHRTWELIKEAPAIKPDPAYVSRFWTELTKEKVSSFDIASLLRMLLKPRPITLKIGAACILAFVVTTLSHTYFENREMRDLLMGIEQSDYKMLQSLSDIEDLEMLQQLEMLENLDLIQNLHEGEI